MSAKDKGPFPGRDEMQQPLEIAFHGLESSQALHDYIREEAGKLGRFGNAVTSARISIERNQSHGTTQLEEVHVDVHTRGGHVFARESVEHRHRGDPQGLYNAVARGVDKAVRQLNAKLEKRSAKPTLAAQEGVATGHLARLDRERRHGFVERTGGPDLFFHEAVLKDGDFDALKEGDEVRFKVAEAEGAYGPQASSVEPLAPGR